MSIFWNRNFHVVESGPCPGVYESKYAYEQHVQKLLEGVRHENPAISVFDQNPWIDEGCGG